MDLRNYPSTPVSKRRRSCFSSSKGKRKASVKDYGHEDVSIDWNDSSDSDNATSSPPCKFAKCDGSIDCIKFKDIRSTPSCGSPVLKKFSTVKKFRKRTGDLIPISPITPGVPDRQSFSKSCISLHVTENSGVKSTTFDHTVLAVPLGDSDDENNSNEDFISPELTIHSHNSKYDIENETKFGNSQNCDDISVLTSQTNNDATGTISQITSDEDIQIDCENPNEKSKGSSWLQEVCEKQDAQRVEIEKALTHFTNDHCDSAKKTKYKKGGLAEQLLRVVKHESSQLAVFNHQIKTKQYQYSGDRLHLRVISDHTEGTVHILECKNLSSTGLKCYTIILPRKIVEKQKLQLLTCFYLYPPWYEQTLDSQVYPILLSANRIQVISAREQDCDPTIDSELFTETQHYESLLTAIENKNNLGHTSVIATVQRVWKKSTEQNVDICSLLLEDAFGIFMEVTVDEELATQSNVIEEGEGHRIILTNVEVNGRITKSQCPQLFSVISSVWGSTGQGLMHVSQSQSQSISSQQDQPLAPPSFCYILSANNGVTKLQLCIDSSSDCLNNEDIANNNESVSYTSGLNRPRLDTLRCDVLYKPSKVLDFYQISSEQDEDLERCTLICKLLYATMKSEDALNHEEICNKDITLQLHVTDSSSKNITTVSLLPSCSREKISFKSGEVLLLKDVQLNNDKELYCDCYSRVYNTKNENLRKIAMAIWQDQKSFTNSFKETQKVNPKSKFQPLSCDITLECIVTIEGRITKVAYTINDTMHCFDCGFDDIANSNENCLRCGSELLFKGSKVPCITVEHKQNKAVVKITKATWEQLTSPIPSNKLTLENLKSLIKRKVGPLTCLVLHIRRSPHLMFYLNEITT